MKVFKVRFLAADDSVRAFIQRSTDHDHATEAVCTSLDSFNSLRGLIHLDTIEIEPRKPVKHYPSLAAFVAA